MLEPLSHVHNCNIIHDLHSILRWAESFCGTRDPPLAQTSTNDLWYLQTRLICAFSCVYEQRYSSGILQSACVNKPFPGEGRSTRRPFSPHQLFRLLRSGGGRDTSATAREIFPDHIEGQPHACLHRVL